MGNDERDEDVEKKSLDFVRVKIEDDIQNKKNDGRVETRFPPEPNGYLHIGHAKSICLNFGIAQDYKGVCHLRFDDTNPVKEDTEYVDSIKEDVKWLGFDWGDKIYYTSDYFESLYDFAVTLIKKGKAYVCSLTAEQTRVYRGSLTEAGKDSPYRDRSVEENLGLFEQMKGWKFEDGDHVLRAKIDMASPNMTLRDPTIYRIRKVSHHRTGDTWCIYPMYDFSHCISDALENITHSICTLEFENNRPLYEWVLQEVETVDRPQQIEFARLNMSYTVMSKRKLRQLVDEQKVDGWDDPRMPTISGLRRRGYTPEAIREFCKRIGVAKFDSVVDKALLEFCIREDLNKKALRVMGVLNPLRVVIENYPADEEEMLEAVNNPEDPNSGTRLVPFSKILYIEREDFMENPPKKFFRLTVGREIRLRYAYFITCTEVVKDEDSGEIIELRCTYDPESKGGKSPDGRKVKATMHWVSAQHAVKVEARLYDHLFTQLKSDTKNWVKYFNDDSLKVIKNVYVEPSLKNAVKDVAYQFERLGYFCLDSHSSQLEGLVFNRTVTLRDTWVKMANNQGKKSKG